MQGETDTPDFMVNISGHKVPLRTKYHAIVDGTNGDTTLERIDASFLNTAFVARGGVYDVKGVKGRRVALDITMDKARLEDVMMLAVKTPQPPMTGALRLGTKFELPPGDQDVVDKLRLDGDFAIGGGRFTDADVQRKINEMSVRALGKTGDGETAPKVASDFSGRFALGNGILTLERLTFNIPGAVVELKGQYALRRETLAFVGNLFMDAKVSEVDDRVEVGSAEGGGPAFPQERANGDPSQDPRHTQRTVVRHRRPAALQARQLTSGRRRSAREAIFSACLLSAG